MAFFIVTAMKTSNLTAFNHNVTRGFCSGPAEEIYTSEACSTDVTNDSHLFEQKYCLRFEVFTAVTMKNAVFWDVRPCGSCKNRCIRVP
jgi:hypothetical protein